MSKPCADCGATHLVAVRLPGHADIEAVLCLACSAVQRPHLAATTEPAPPR